MKKVLVFPMYGIGDVLMTTPAIRNLKEQLEAEITYLHMFKTTKEILQNNPFIRENIHFPFLDAGRLEGVRFLLQFRKKFDCSINFYPSNRRDYNLASFIVGSPLRCGHRYVQRNFFELNFLKNSTIGEDDRLHNVEEDLRLLEFIGIPEKKLYPLEVYLTEEEKMFAGKWLKERRVAKKMLCGIHPGTSTFKNHGKKRWPEKSFAALIDRLGGDMGDVAFMLFGGPEEKTLRDSIVSLVRHPEKVLSVEGISIRQSAALMEMCALFISNDSGPMHMAAAMRVPTVSIFGPTNPVWVRPWWVKHRVVRSGLSCSPCFRYSPKPLKCRYNDGYACLTQVGVDQVFRACMGLLSELHF
ncbi:MAG: glycosyltransferase family 9 protein [Nitrospiraceae bacterium]|nr:glycosyltransferase family 9 protein [Nitrospiraceae bacterium]